MSAVPKAETERSTNTYEANRDNAENTLWMRLEQAWALSTFLAGAGGETFRTYRDDIQSGVLWGLSSLIDDARVAFHKSSEAQKVKS